MRADRLLSIVLLLQVHRRLTARELAGRLEVSERTILRDMDALGAAGIPVVAERGAGGGWSLMEGYRTDLTGLSESEAQALFLAGPSRLLADLRLEKAAEGALLKLLAALPSVFRRGADSARQRIHIDVTGWGTSEESFPHLQTLQEAVWHERRLHLLYSRSDCQVERIVDPLGLVAKGSVWYLVAGVEGEIRSYRVSRVRDAQLLDEPCVRPEGFDLAAWWARSAAVFKESLPRYAAAFRVHPDVLPRLRFGGRFARIGTLGEPDAEGWPRVEVRFDMEDLAAEWALGFGPQVEVLEPPALRQRMARMAAAVAALYAAEGRSG